MRAFVTGATGFIGAALVERLVAADIPVAIVSRPASDPWRLKHLLPRLVRFEGDLHDPDTIRDALRTYRPDTVFHLAWHGVGNRHRNDLDQIHRNLQSTVRFVQLAAEAGCRKWIGAGSQAEYGPQQGALAEDAHTLPTTVYGAAKLSAYHLGSRVAEVLDLPFAWIRVFSTYGPKDNPEWMIPNLVRTLLEGNRPALTRAEQRWDYLFVRDAADAFLAVGNTPNATGIFNLGSGEARPLQEFVTLVRNEIDPSLPLGFGEIPYRPDQVMWLQADTRKLRSTTGWQPRYSWLEGIRETISWHRNPSS